LDRIAREAVDPDSLTHSLKKVFDAKKILFPDVTQKP